MRICPKDSAIVAFSCQEDNERCVPYFLEWKPLLLFFFFERFVRLLCFFLHERFRLQIDALWVNLKFKFTYHKWQENGNCKSAAILLSLETLINKVFNKKAVLSLSIATSTVLFFIEFVQLLFKEIGKWIDHFCALVFVSDARPFDSSAAVHSCFNALCTSSDWLVCSRN